jgi:hypothetical protein
MALLSSIGRERGMGASLVVEGSTNGTVFETYLEDVLYPTLQKGQVVMDNLPAHKGESVRELIEGKGCELSSTCRRIRRVQPHRASFLQAQKLPQGCMCSQPRYADGGHRQGT